MYLINDIKTVSVMRRDIIDLMFLIKIASGSIDCPDILSGFNERYI